MGRDGKKRHALGISLYLVHGFLCQKAQGCCSGCSREGCCSGCSQRGCCFREWGKGYAELTVSGAEAKADAKSEPPENFDWKEEHLALKEMKVLIEDMKRRLTDMDESNSALNDKVEKLQKELQRFREEENKKPCSAKDHSEVEKETEGERDENFREFLKQVHEQARARVKKCVQNIQKCMDQIPKGGNERHRLFRQKLRLKLFNNTSPAVRRFSELCGCDAGYFSQRKEETCVQMQYQMLMNIAQTCLCTPDIRPILLMPDQAQEENTQDCLLRILGSFVDRPENEDESIPTQITDSEFAQRFFLLYGPPGTGKTHFAMGVAF